MNNVYWNASQPQYSDAQRHAFQRAYFAARREQMSHEQAMQVAQEVAQSVRNFNRHVRQVAH